MLNNDDDNEEAWSSQSVGASGVSKGSGEKDCKVVGLNIQVLSFAPTISTLLPLSHPQSSLLLS